MEGGGRKKNGEFPSDAGVIPRAVKQIFNILEAQNAEYSMKVTFLELYNEEITDLLAPEELSKFVDDKSKKPIALMEDGKGGVFVRGLEEEIVCTANEIYKILEKGSAKRRTASSIGAQRVRHACIAFRSSYVEQNTEACMRCAAQVKQEYAIVKEKLQNLFRLEKQIVDAGGAVPVLYN